MATGERRAGLREAVDLLGRNRDFRRLFLASVISLGGDWFLFVAVGALVLEATGTAISIGLLVLAQDLPVFFATPWAGWLADHMDRRLLMIWCDWARVIVCASFLLVGPDNLWLAYVLLAILAVFAAAFDPASSAAIPNVVDPEDLPVANAMGGSLWGTMLAVGAAVGGIITAALGHDAAFVIDAASFAVSALLLTGVRRPFAERDAAQHERVGAMEAARETVAYARQDHRVMALISVKFGFGLAGGVLALIVVLAETVFDAGAVGFGILLAARGVGALIGPFIGHRVAGTGHRRLMPVIAGALAVFGLGYVAVGAAPTLWFAAFAVMVAHLGGGAQWVLSSFGLQRIVPDRIRGRIFSFDFALITLTFSISAVIASYLADRIGVREAIQIVGGLALGWSVVWWFLTKRVRHRPLFDDDAQRPEPVPEPGPEPV
ncbi:MAG TPA: MFS transporter [Actinomycetota bacterium]|nr:MFS transporter [Actinomycetota bacterium]